MEISREAYEAMVNSKPRPVYVKSTVTVEEFNVTEVGEPAEVSEAIVAKFPGLAGIKNIMLEGERLDLPIQPVVMDSGTLYQALATAGIPPEENKKTKKIVIPDFMCSIKEGKVTCAAN
jgi:hypothetical protein